MLSGVTIVRHGCDGAIFPAPHGTAVASLLVGQGEGFESVIPGATLYASDIFCGHGGGSLSLLALALDWMAREKIPVVNVSLVGAKSILLTGLVRAMTARGFLLVAAVGNDGPTAPPLYPAAYPDVVGVTGVDGKRRVLPEACRGEQVDFAAAGADLKAAAVGGGFDEMRGTSFATPIVAGLLARSLQAPDPAGAREALAALESTALDIGNNGTDPSYGKGLVGADLHPGRGTKQPRPDVLATEDRGWAAAKQEQDHEHSQHPDWRRRGRRAGREWQCQCPVAGRRRERGPRRLAHGRPGKCRRDSGRHAERLAARQHRCARARA